MKQSTSTSWNPKAFEVQPRWSLGHVIWIDCGVLFFFGFGGGQDVSPAVLGCHLNSRCLACSLVNIGEEASQCVCVCVVLVNCWCNMNFCPSHSHHFLWRNRKKMTYDIQRLFSQGSLTTSYGSFDGKNPTPLSRVRKCIIAEIKPSFAPPWVVQDFFHQQYVWYVCFLMSSHDLKIL